MLRDLRDLTANSLTNVRRDVDIERRLLLVSGEILENQTTNDATKQGLT